MRVSTLNDEAHAIDPSICLPQKNPALVNREMSKDLRATSKNAMDVLELDKTKTVTSIACIGTIQDREILQAFTSTWTLLSWECFLSRSLSHFSASSC
jgi:hypothetical protein